jgi:hypothetical protein
MSINEELNYALGKAISMEKVRLGTWLASALLLWIPYSIFLVNTSGSLLAEKIVMYISITIITPIPLYFNIRKIKKLGRVVVELYETPEFIEGSTYSREKVAFTKSSCKIDIYKWKIKLDTVSIGRRVVSNKKDYFIPDSEFVSPAEQDL